MATATKTKSPKKRKRRQYDNDYPSVTTVLGVLRKIALESWFKYNTARFCNAKSSKGKLIGAQIHEGIHNLIQTGEIAVKTEYTEEVTNALKAFVQFRKDYPNLAIENSEVALTSRTHRYTTQLLKALPTTFFQASRNRLTRSDPRFAPTPPRSPGSRRPPGCRPGSAWAS